jgi:hypothetical protein
MQTNSDEALAVEKRGGFTCKHSPTMSDQDMWIAHDAHGHAAGDFRSEDEAQRAVERWNNSDAHKVTVDWASTPELGDDYSNRGDYTIRVEGTRWSATTSGTFGMEGSTRILVRLRDAVAKHGLGVVQDVLNAASR